MSAAWFKLTWIRKYICEYGPREDVVVWLSLPFHLFNSFRRCLVGDNPDCVDDSGDKDEEEEISVMEIAVVSLSSCYI